MARSDMYTYRKLSPREQVALLAERRAHSFPWHGPPHPEAPGDYRIITATCFEHRHLLNSPQRLIWFEEQLLYALEALGSPVAAWCVLPNHYHALVQILEMKAFAGALGQLHGRTSFEMNGEDNQRGRKVWYRCQDRIMRSEGHFWTSLNYVHHNPVKHGYVCKWQEWPYSSVHGYLETKGRDWLMELWREYPLRDYGKGWDD
jgi:putative transposase